MAKITKEELLLNRIRFLHNRYKGYEQTFAEAADKPGRNPMTAAGDRTTAWVFKEVALDLYDLLPESERE